MSSYTFKSSKHEEEKIDFGIDWSAQLTAVDPGDVIVDSLWSLESNYLDESTVLISDQIFDDSSTYVTVEGGINTERVRLINKVITITDRVFIRSILVEVTNK